MEIAKSFEPHAIEAKWYPFWESRGLFKPSMQPGATPFCIQLPPPNVTGTLHMGHAFQQTLMDVLIRYHRMRGDNTLWQVGTDHAGIATQIVVENQLQAEGNVAPRARRERSSSSASGHGKQESARRSPARCGGSARRATGRASASPWTRAVRRGDRDLRAALRGRPRSIAASAWSTGIRSSAPRCPTSRSRARKRRQALGDPLSARRRLRASSTVATTRPETMLGDVAVAVNPDDARYAHLVGKEVELPLTGRRIPVIADAYVDKDFGTGVVKITPAHDFNDWEVAQRHGLAPLTIFTLRGDGQRQRAGEVSRPRSLRGAQGACSRISTAAGLVAGEKPHKMVVPRCGRTGEIVEPMLTDQWFVAMTKPAPDTHVRVFPASRSRTSASQAVNASLRRSGRWRRQRRSASCPSTGRRPTTTGSTTSTTGASRASSGGAIAFRRGTTTRATSIVARNADEAASASGQAGQRAAAGRRRARHLVLVRAVVPLDARLAGADARARDVPAELGAGHRLRHHLLLGRAHDHDDDLLHRQACRSATCTSIRSCATRKGRRCRSRRATSSIRST